MVTLRAQLGVKSIAKHLATVSLTATCPRAKLGNFRTFSDLSRLIEKNEKQIKWR